MNRAQNIFIGALVGIVLSVGVGAFLYANHETAVQPAPSVGAVATGQEYNSTTTISTSASATAIYQAKTGSGSLGSITISSTSPAFTSSTAFFGVYDGVGATTTASSTLAKFPANAPAGTYVFDSTFSHGMEIEVPPGFNGAWTVTWR